MAETELLLSMLQFVALVAPAIAILMRVVKGLQEDIDSIGVPTEFRILQWAMFLMVIGGMLIGFRLLQMVNDPIIFWGIILVFGALPFLAVALWLNNARISWETSSTDDFGDFIKHRGLEFSSIGIPTFIVGGLYLGSSLFFSYFLALYLNLGYIQDLQYITPTTFFGAVLSILFLKNLQILYDNGLLPGTNYRGLIYYSIEASLIYLLGYLVFNIIAILLVVVIVGGILSFVLSVVTQIEFLGPRTIELFANAGYLISFLMLLLVITFPHDIEDSDEAEKSDETEDTDETDGSAKTEETEETDNLG